MRISLKELPVQLVLSSPAAVCTHPFSAQLHFSQSNHWQIPIELSMDFPRVTATPSSRATLDSDSKPTLVPLKNVCHHCPPVIDPDVEATPCGNFFGLSPKKGPCNSAHLYPGLTLKWWPGSTVSKFLLNGAIPLRNILLPWKARLDQRPFTRLMRLNWAKRNW